MSTMATIMAPTEADRNFAVFQRELPELLATHPGKFALMHDGSIVDFFDSIGDAARQGRKLYGEAFSVQEVASKNESLGFYSYAVHQLSDRADRACA
jgi:hypothetical protein